MAKSPPAAARSARALAALAAAVLGGCALDWAPGGGTGTDGGGTSGASGSGGSGSTSGSGSSGGTSGASGSSGTRGSSGASGSSGTSGAPADAGATCRATSECPAGAVCHFADHLCGAGQPGHCRANRTGCPNTPAPTTQVCGCDSVIYSDECVANGNGKDTTTAGSCATPAFRYRCGDVFCVTGTPAYADFCVRHGASELVYSCDNTATYGCSQAQCTGGGCSFGACACSALPGGALVACP